MALLSALSHFHSPRCMSGRFSVVGFPAQIDPLFARQQVPGRSLHGVEGDGHIGRHVGDAVSLGERRALALDLANWTVTEEPSLHRLPVCA
jgi:hypothetical protein